MLSNGHVPIQAPLSLGQAHEQALYPYIELAADSVDAQVGNCIAISRIKPFTIVTTLVAPQVLTVVETGCFLCSHPVGYVAHNVLQVGIRVLLVRSTDSCTHPTLLIHDDTTRRLSWVGLYGPKWVSCEIEVRLVISRRVFSHNALNSRLS